MLKRVSFSTGLVLLLSLWFVGYGRTANNVLLARIGATEITVEELRRFKAETPALLRSEKEGIEEVRDYLQTMIDTELMLLEVREQGIEQDPEFLRKWEEERRKKLVAEFLDRKIWGKIELSTEELHRRFAESKWNRTLKLAHIRVETEEETRRVMRELEQGRPFEEVARARSIDQATAPKGGEIESFYGRLNLLDLGVTPAIGEELLDLGVGAFSRPFQVADGYEIFKVMEDRPAPSHYSGIFARQTLKREFQTRWKELVAELASEFEVRLDRPGISLLIEKAPRVEEDVLELSAQEQQMPLCHFRGGELTLEDFLNAYQRARPAPLDSSGIVELVNRRLLPDVLLYQAAVQEGVEEDESVATWLEAKKEAMLVEALRKREVDERIVIDDEAARGYYETHLGRFMQPEDIWMVEILVKTREEAEGLLERIRRGEYMEELAARFSIRPGAERNEGVFHMHPFEWPTYGALLNEAREADAGELRGPVEVKEGYSVFKVLDKIAPKPEPFERAASRARYWLRKQEENRLFEALLVKLREKYAAKVVLFEDRLGMGMDE